ncbi:MAG: polysaccharide deacetylase family protein [Chitinophagaceae bacterium]
MRNIFLSAAFLLLLSLKGNSQFNQPWRGKKCAVVITYDDAIDQHLDNAIPVLDSLGLKATFYVTAFSPSVQTRLPDWKKLAVNGHELGNHTLYHPCIGGAGREWVRPEYDLRQYTVQRMTDETRMTNLFLQALDGKTKRTFAFTCGEMKIGDSSFINGMKNDFVAARAVRKQLHKINEVDLYNVDCYMVNGETGEQMIGWVKKAMETNSLLVILFHGVGGGNGLDVTIPAHRELLIYLNQNEKDLYIAPMLEVAEHIKEWQERNKPNKATQQATNQDHQYMLKQLWSYTPSQMAGVPGLYDKVF